MKISYFFTYLLISLFAYSCLGLFSPAHAQSLGFTISPPTVEKTVTPGKPVQGILKVFNATDTPLTFSVGKQDFVVVDDKGTPVHVPAGVPDKFAASSWVSFGETSIDVDAHDSGSIVYTITAPSYVSPGGYYMAVTFHPESSSPKSGAAIQPVIQSLFLLTVPGTMVEDAKITQFQAPNFQEYGPVKITTQVQNNGDAHIKPSGMITISDMLGRQIAILTLEPHNIFPGGTLRTYTNTLSHHWLIGMYTAQLSLTYGKQNHLLSAKTTFIVFPWRIAVVVLLIIITIILILLSVRKRRKSITIEANIAIGQENNPQ